MKGILISTALLFVCLVSFAQWQGTNPVYFNSGRVGIGTSNPQGYLHVNPNRPVIIKNNGGSGVYGSEIGFNAILNTAVYPNLFTKLGGTSQQGGASIVVDQTGNMLFQLFDGGTLDQVETNFAPQIIFKNDGKVGFGTVPSTLLHLEGTSGLQSRVTISNPTVGSQGASYDITMGSGSSYGYAAGMRAYVAAGQPGVDRVSLGLYTTTYNGSLQSRVEGLTLFDNGNVGVGVQNPQYKLHVIGSGHFQNRLSVQGEMPNDNNAAFWNNSTTGYGLYSQGGAGGRYAFHFLNKEGVSLMYGRGDGNIGIGTTSPDAKLAVKGTVHAQEVKVDLLVPGPDYVFEPTYQLTTLAETEAYIKANKHLPEVPSAKEMEENGINLSEMNMLLLKKVEELTLHLIEQQKQNEKQQKEIEYLKTKIK